MPVFRALAFLLLHGSDGPDTRAMMATTPAEVGEIVHQDSDGGRYANGRTLAEGTAAQVRANPAVIEAYLGVHGAQEVAHAGD